MRSNQLVFSIILSLFAGVAGYHLRALQNDPAHSALAARDVPGLESFQQAQSFSEVQNAKSLLQALAEQCMVEVRTHLTTDFARNKIHSSIGLKPVITELKSRIKEFRGTEQELHLTRELLLVLKRQGDADEWLNTYLDVIYEHPSAELISLVASEAVQLAAQARRSGELRVAFEHLIEIPRHSGVREQLALVMAAFQPPEFPIRSGS